MGLRREADRLASEQDFTELLSHFRTSYDVTDNLRNFFLRR
jgi:hypothetical protein